MEIEKAKQQEVKQDTEQIHYQLFMRHRGGAWSMHGQLTTSNDNILIDLKECKKYSDKRLEPYEYKILSFLLPY